MSKRNTYNLSRPHLTTGNIGGLYPINVTEVLPNDTARLNTNVMCRLAPMIAPIYQRLDLRVHHFYMSTRNIWDEWNEWIRDTGNGYGPDEAVDWENFVLGKEPRYGKTVDGKAYPRGQTLSFATDTEYQLSLANYFGLPNTATGGDSYTVNQAPFIMYNSIYNQYYSDEQLAKTPTHDYTPLDYDQIRNVMRQKDYFTTARLEQVLDDEYLSIPVKNDAFEVYTNGPIGSRIGVASDVGAQSLNDDTTQIITGSDAVDYRLRAGGGDGIDIQELRRALALNNWSELQNKYGTRYVEYMRYYLNSRMPRDEDKPIYLGGGSAPINISEVLQTAPETQSAGNNETEYGVGDLYGHGISAFRSNECMSTFDEHGYIMTLLSVRPTELYTQGIERHWLKAEREDYYDPLLARIGMQPILEEEVFHEGNQTQVWPEPPSGNHWGWTNRYEEYRWSKPMVSGEFRDLLNYWHMGRELDAVPPLNNYYAMLQQPIEPELDRPFAVPGQDHCWLNTYNKVKIKRHVSRATAGKTL